MANQVLFSKTQPYSVGSARAITLTVTIGDGQVGGSSVMWQGKTIAQGEVKGLDVGGTGSLIGEVLICTTTVQDINPATNHTSVTYDLGGGESDQSFTYTIDVSEPGGSAIYSITFVFI